MYFVFFFFNDTATTEIYTLSLHDALPIWPPLDQGAGALPVQVLQGRREDRRRLSLQPLHPRRPRLQGRRRLPVPDRDRKSTRLNSSHANISYAVFCLKKKKTKNNQSSLTA